MADENDTRNQNRPKKDDGGKGQGQGPKTALALTLEKIEDKKVTVKATLYNSLSERVLRFIVDNTTFSDGIKKTENKEAIYSFALSDKMSEIRVKVEVIDWKQVNDQITVRLDLQSSGQAKQSDVKKKKMVEISGPIGKEKKFSILVTTQKNQSVGLFSRAVLTASPLRPAGPRIIASDLSFNADDDGILHLFATFTGKDTLVIFTAGKETEKRMLIK